jgi:hypothetical protein
MEQGVRRTIYNAHSAFSDLAADDQSALKQFLTGSE